MKYYLITLTLLSFLLIGCKQEFENPTFGEEELNLFLHDNGTDLVKWPYQEMEVTVGDTMRLEIMLSPSEGVSTIWIDKESNDTIGHTNLFTYAPAEKEQKNILFVATKENGTSREVEFKINSFYPEELYSEPMAWKYKAIGIGSQTGTFTATFDVLANGSDMDTYIGLCHEKPNNITALPLAIHFKIADTKGIIECSKADGSYGFDNEVNWSFNQKISFKLEVNVANGTYSLWESSSMKPIAENYGFSQPVYNLDNWSLYGGNVAQKSSLSLYNIKEKEISQQTAPIFSPIEPINIREGNEEIVEVKVIDPQNTHVSITCGELPRFCTFTDNGNNTASLQLKPYADCGGCDVGEYNIMLTATNSIGISSTYTLTVNVIPYNTEETVDIIPGLQDGFVSDGGVVNTSDPNGARIMYDGTNYHVAVFNFQLPEIPIGATITNVQLKMKLSRKDAVNYNADLYGIEHRDSPQIIASDFYKGTFQSGSNSGNGNDWGIMDNFFSSESVLGWQTTNDEANVQLTQFITWQYENGGANRYVFMRLNMDSDEAAPWQRYGISTSEMGGDAPVLSITYKVE